MGKRAWILAVLAIIGLGAVAVRWRRPADLSISTSNSSSAPVAVSIPRGPTRTPTPVPASRAVEPRFSRESVQVRTPSGAVRLSLQGITIGERSLLPEGWEQAEPRTGSGETIYARGAVTERYVPRGDAVELLFDFDRSVAALRDQGDLRIGVRLDTDLKPELIQDHAVMLRRSDGSHGLSIGAATAIDADGHRGRLRYELKDGLLTMVLPGDYVVAAAFPLTVDPLIGSNSYIDSYLNIKPDVVFGPTGDVAFVVSENTYGGGDIRARAVNAGLYPSNPFVIEGSGRESRNPRVARSGGNQYLVVWQERLGQGAFSIQGQFFSIDTGPAINNAPTVVAIGNKFAISSGGEDTNPDVGYSPTSNVFVVAWERAASASNHNILGTTVAMNGSLGSLLTIDASGTYQETPTVSPALTGQVGVAWIRRAAPGAQGDVYACALNAGTGAVGAATAVSTNAADELSPSLGGAGATGYLVWTRKTAAGDGDIWARRTVFSAGTVTFGTAFAVDSTGTDAGSPSCDAVTVGATSRLMVGYLRNPTSPKTLDATRTVGMVYDSSVDPPVLVEAPTVSTSSDDDDHVSVSVSPTTLVALAAWDINGSIVGQQVFLSSGGSIALSMTSVGVASLQGSNPPSVQFPSIFNLGTGTISPTITSNQAWISATTSTSFPGGYSSIYPTYNTTGLAAGEYTATLTVTSAGSLNSPQTFTVNLTVLSIAWVTPPTGGYVGGQSVSASWSFTSGTQTATANSLHYQSGSPPNQYGSAGPNLGGAPGTYSSTIEAPVISGTSNLYLQPVVTVRGVAIAGPSAFVSLAAPSSPVISSYASPMTFTAAVGGPDPNSQTLAFFNGISGTLSYTTSTTAAWLKVLPPAGTATNSTAGSLLVYVSTAGLSAGTYTGSVVVTSPGATNSPKSFPVTLNLAGCSWNSAPTGAYLSGQVIPLNWTINSGTLSISNAGVRYSVNNPPWGYALSSTQTGSSGPFNDVLIAPSVSVPTVYYLGAEGQVNSAYVRSSVAQILVNPAPTISLSSSALAFSSSSGGVAAPSQTIQVRNSGVGALNWSTSSSSAWLTATASGSSATEQSSPMTVSVDATGLSTGTYMGTITVSAAGAGNTPQTLTVVLVVSSISWVTPPTGPVSSGQSMTMSWSLSAGNWTATQNQVSYAAVDPPWGGLSTVNQPGGNGTYSATIQAPVVTVPTTFYFRPHATFGGELAGGPLATVLVNPSATPQIGLPPAGPDFVAALGGAQPSAQTVSISNAGGGTLSWTASANQPWVTLTPSSGSIATNESQTFSVAVSTVGLPAGVSNATITVTAAGAGNTPRTLPVKVTMVGLAWATPPSGLFIAGQTVPFSWTLTAGTLSTPYHYVLYDTNNPPQYGGGSNNQPGSTGTYTGSITAPYVSAPTTYYLAPVAYLGSLTVYGPSASILVSPATAPAISLYPNPPTMSLTALVGGSSPGNQSMTIYNSGAGTLNWTATSDAAWLGITIPSGSLGSYSYAYPYVTVNSTGLAGGVYTGHITVTDPQATNSPVVLTVTLTMTPPPANDNFANRITISGASAAATGNNLAATGEPGEPGSQTPLNTAWWTWTAPSSGTVTINTFGSNFDTYLSVYTGSAVNALTLVAQNNDAPGSSQSQVTFAATAGTAYQIQVDGTFSYVGSISLQVSMSPRIQIDTPAIAMSLPQGPGAASQTFQIRNVGAGTLNWSLSSNQPWLTAGSPSSGALASGTTASAVFTVNSTGLAPGVYTGSLSITDAAAANSPYAITVTFTVIGVNWITPPASGYASGATITVSWSLVSGSLSATHNDVHLWTTQPWTGYTVSNQPGPAGTYTASFTAPYVSVPTVLSVGAHASVGAWTAQSPVQTILVTPTQPLITLVQSTAAFAAPLGSTARQSSALQMTVSNGLPLDWSGDSDAPWLTMSPSSGTLTGYSSVTLGVSVDPAGLAAGTYIGHIAITDPSASNSPQMITVSLTVGSVSWVSPPSGTYAAGQTITASWSASIGSQTSTSNGVHYGSANPPVGAYERDAQNGGSGTFLVEFPAPMVASTTTMYFRPHVTVQGTDILGPVVSATITPPAGPYLNLNASTLNFSGLLPGAAPAGQSVLVSNAGTGTLGWSVASNSSWLSAGTPSGSLGAGASQSVPVTVDVTGLTAGVYAGTLTFTAAGAANSPRSLPVTLILTQKPALQLSGSPNLVYSLPPGATSAIPQWFTFSNSGGQILHWTATKTAAWMTLSSTSGQLSSNSTATIYVYIDATGLSPGTYTDTVSLSDPAASNSPVTVPVTLKVPGAAPTITTSPASVSVTRLVGDTYSSGTYVDIANIGGGTLNWTITSNAAWLTFSSTSGTSSYYSSYTYFNVNSTGLAAGTYSATATITGTGATNSPLLVPVTLTVSPKAPRLQLSSSTLSFSCAEGAAAPPRQTVTLNNTGYATLNWTASSGSASWLTVNPSFGALGQGVSQTLSIGVDPAGLTQGVYNGTLTFTAPGALNTPQTISVTLTVGAPAPVLSLQSTRVTYGMAQGGGDPADSSFKVSNTGAGTMNWSVTSDSSWVTVTPSSGSLASGASSTVTLSVTGGNRPAGTYAASLTFSAPGATNGIQTVTVALTVASVAWVSTPGANYSGGQTIPFSWSVDVGGGTTGWNVVCYGTTNPPWNDSQTASQHGPGGVFSGSVEAPVFSQPTALYFGIQVYLSGTYVKGPVVSTMIAPAASAVIQIPTKTLTLAAKVGETTIRTAAFSLSNGGPGTVNWSASSDRPWLTVSPTSGVRSGTQYQTVSVQADPTGLAAGTYTGTITVTDPGATNSPQKVTVTLAVVSIAWTSPPAASYTGGQTVSFTWTSSEPNSSPSTFYSSSYPPTGGSTITTSMVSPGVFTGSLPVPIVTSAQSYFFVPQVYVNGSYLLGPPAQVVFYPPTTPVISWSPSSVTINAVQGGANPPAVPRTLQNTGTQPLNWTASANQPWLSASPASGVLAPSASTSVNVQADTTGLAVGTYTGTLTMTDPAAINSPVSMTVTLIVGTPPANDAFASRISIVGANATVTGSNIGATGEASEPNGSSPLHTVWWTWTPAVSGTVSIDTFGSTFDTYLTVFTGTSLAALTYVASNDDSSGTQSRVQFTATAGTAYQIQVDGYSSATGPITLHVASAPKIAVTPASLAFVGLQGGLNPSGQALTLENSGAGTLNWTVSDGAAWLGESPASGALTGGSQTSILVSINTAGLAPGAYTANITISDPAATNNPVVIPVSLTVATIAWSAPPPSTVVSGQPLSASWTVTIGGEVSSYNQLYYGLTNPPFSGSYGLNMPGPTGTYQDSVTAPNVTVNQVYYVAARAVVDGTTLTGPVATVTVTPPAKLALSPSGLSFSGVQYGANPANQTLTVSNPGTSPLTWQAAEWPEWVTLSATAGTIAAGGSQPLTVSVDISGLPAGTFPGTIRVIASGVANSPQSVPVTLTVAGDSTAPTIAGVTSTSPSGLYLEGDPINVTVTFSEPVVLAGGNLQISLNSGAGLLIAPFGPAATVSATYTVAAGEACSALSASSPLVLVGGATLRDQAGNPCVLSIPGGQNIQNTKTITIDTLPPTVTLTTPTAGPTYAATTSPLAVTGTAFDNAGVASVTWTNSATGQSGVATGTTSWSASIPLKPGSNPIVFFVWDTAGLVTTRLLQVDYTPTDNVPPMIVIANPSGTGAFSTAATPVTVSGTATDNVGVSLVRWSNAATGASGIATGTASWSASVALTSGANDITVTASDAAGNSTAALIVVTLTPPADLVPPVVTITTPTASATYSTSASPVNLGGTASDNIGVASVTWRNAATGATGIASGTTAWTASVPLASGSNAITVTATDPSGNTATDVLTVTYNPAAGDILAPVVQILSPTSAATLSTDSSSVVLGGLAADNVGLTSVVWSNAATAQSASTTGLGTWSATIPLNVGSNVVTLTAYDAAGNTGTAAITITYAPQSGGGGGGGGGGCGLTGLEALLALVLLRRLRRR